jgi:hypothetical protein
MRARLIDGDGVSLFEDIPDDCREIFLRYVPVEPVFDVATVRETPIWDHLISARIERYRREVWYVPVGPLACPIGKPGDQLDARYVFDGMER